MAVFGHFILPDDQMGEWGSWHSKQASAVSSPPIRSRVREHRPGENRRGGRRARGGRARRVLSSGGPASRRSSLPRPGSHAARPGRGRARTARPRGLRRRARRLRRRDTSRRSHRRDGESAWLGDRRRRRRGTSRAPPRCQGQRAISPGGGRRPPRASRIAARKTCLVWMRGLSGSMDRDLLRRSCWLSGREVLGTQEPAEERLPRGSGPGRRVGERFGRCQPGEKRRSPLSDDGGEREGISILEPPRESRW